MSVFPLNIEKKEDHPDKVAALIGVLTKYYLKDDEINKIVTALTELNGRAVYGEFRVKTGIALNFSDFILEDKFTFAKDINGGNFFVVDATEKGDFKDAKIFFNDYNVSSSYLYKVLAISKPTYSVYSITKIIEDYVDLEEYNFNVWFRSAIGELESFIVTGTTFGRFGDGDEVPAHENVNLRFKDAYTKRIPASYTGLNGSITNVSQTVEKGTDLNNLTVNISFNKNDAGNPTGFALIRDNTTTVGNSQNNVIDLINIINTITLKGVINYSDGIIKNDNLGDASPNGRILAGTYTTSNRSINTIIPQFYGKMTTDEPLDTYAGLSLHTKVITSSTNLSQEITLADEYLFFIVNSSSKSVYDNDTNFIISLGDWNSTTDEFIKKTFTITLAGGTTENLTIYRTRLKKRQTLNVRLQ